MGGEGWVSGGAVLPPLLPPHAEKTNEANASQNGRLPLCIATPQIEKSIQTKHTTTACHDVSKVRRSLHYVGKQVTSEPTTLYQLTIRQLPIRFQES
jgi:hypothetical protein